jgi:hypothetical protein
MEKYIKQYDNSSSPVPYNYMILGREEYMYIWNISLDDAN